VDFLFPFLLLSISSLPSPLPLCSCSFLFSLSNQARGIGECGNVVSYPVGMGKSLDNK